MEALLVMLFRKKRDQGLRRITAFHEAGHAAARDALGGPLQDVSIGQHGSGLTTPKYSRWFGPDLMSKRSGQLRVVIAGPLVEARHRHITLEQAILDAGSGFRSDGAQIGTLLRGDSLDTWAGKTKWLLWGHGRGIKDLAEALLDRGSIPGAEARRILHGKR